ncbi:MAG: hypothetical protein U5K73_04330 [Halofilum sp. (in: g-proteobacteria)]|nr:hypothetical protein [Halofilum sp. (in: g-proteobacteria)]
MMVWATVVGVDYESPSGEQAGGTPSVLDAMEIEYQSYADVMAEQ